MFNFNIDKRIIYVIIAILVVFSVVNYTRNPIELVALLLTLPGVIIAITFHEFAHAFAADKLGDDTPRYQKRLTLNPLAHIDPIGFFMLIFVHFGWGKPVEINPTNFNRKRSMSAQEAIVAFAGPLMNILIAIVLTIVLYTIGKFAPFHKGHEYLIETALKDVDDFYVVIYDTPQFDIDIDTKEKEAAFAPKAIGSSA